MSNFYLTKTFRLPALVTLGLLLILISACNLPSAAQATETPSIDTTQAYQTIQARLTEAVGLTPSPTASPTQTETPAVTATFTPSPTLLATVTTGPTVTATTGVGCDQASPGSPIDVTIPDDTVLKPGETFTKVWRLRNSGTCAWTTSYSAVYFSGEKMGAPETVALSASVAVGNSIDISVEMTAPLTPGTYQSNWKLRNAGGVLFGLGPGDGLPFYVRIIVANQATVSPTANPSITVTPTPGAQAAGPATLLPGDQIDLDSNSVNGSGADAAYQLNAGDGKHYLQPQGSATLGLYGGFRPNQTDCQATNLGASPINVQDLAIGTYLCYRTDQGRYGYARLTGFDTGTARLNLDIFTWQSP